MNKTKELPGQFENPEEDPIFWAMNFDFGRWLYKEGYVGANVRWKENYNNYIASKPWKDKCKKLKKEADYKCQLCYAGGTLHLHHKTYERLGKELDDDLIVLCSSCHRKLHKEDPHE